MLQWQQAPARRDGGPDSSASGMLVEAGRSVSLPAKFIVEDTEFKAYVSIHSSAADSIQRNSNVKLFTIKILDAFLVPEQIYGATLMLQVQPLAVSVCTQWAQLTLRLAYSSAYPLLCMAAFLVAYELRQTCTGLFALSLAL